MSARESVYVWLAEQAEPPVSPNRTVSAVTAEIRLFYPPNQLGLAREMLDRAYLDALREVTERMEMTASPLPPRVLPAVGSPHVVRAPA